MNITKQHLKQIIKEEIMKAESRSENSIEEGWKEAAVAAAMGLSSLGAPTPAAAAPVAPVAYTQVMASDAKNLLEIAEKLEKYSGPSRETYWISNRTWTPEVLQEDTLAAWVEVMVAVDDFWTNTLPNKRAGCKMNPELQVCHILKQIEDQFDDEVGSVLAEVERQQDKGATKVKRNLAKKMSKIIDRWVPNTKSDTDFQRTEGWTDNAKGFDFDQPGQQPDDDDL